MLRIVTGLLLMAILSACSMPETRIYSLNMPIDRHPAAPVAEAVTVSVSSPRYLTQPYIAYRSSDYQLAIARYAKWTASPDEMVMAAVRDSLAAPLFREVRTAGFVPDGSYALQVNLKRFERLDEGSASFAELVFDVSLTSPAGKNLYQQSIARKVRLEDRTFLSLARGMSAALGEGTAEARMGMSVGMNR
jgi:uncharacterized lipoprotein YmbA